jgi:hypothetical protein
MVMIGARNTRSQGGSRRSSVADKAMSSAKPIAFLRYVSLRPVSILHQYP